MSKQSGKQQETVGDALARRVEARRGAASAWAEALRELGAVDRAVYEAVARTPIAELDGPVRRLLTPPTTRACGSALPPRSPCSAAGAGAGRRWRAWSRLG